MWCLEPNLVPYKTSRGDKRARWGIGPDPPNWSVITPYDVQWPKNFNPPKNGPKTARKWPKMRNSPKMGQKWFFWHKLPKKNWSVVTPYDVQWPKNFNPQKNGPKTARKWPKMKNSPKMGQKWFFGPNSLWKILIFWEIIHFYKILKKQSNPGKLHTLGVEVALGEVWEYVYILARRYRYG